MRTVPAIAFLALFTASAAGQRLVYSPDGTTTNEGNANNTIPFWSQSATYMQIHDFANMSPVVGGVPTPILGMVLRKDGGVPSAVAARTLDVQITVNNTTVDSASATFDYANNLGPNPTIVLPFTTVNLPALTNMSMPNPPGWQLPWPTPFVYVAVPGMHFCWEWRHLNASDFSNAAMDAVSGYSASTLPSEGTGCTTMGQSRPATITSRSLNLITGAYRQQMRYGAANAPAVLAIGVQRVNLQLPGQCAPLLVNPLTFVSGGLDGAGEWDFNVNFPTPIGGSGNLLAQFVWVDPGLALNLGLSDMSVLDMPLRGSRFMIRLYTAPYQGGAGFETATMATGSTRSYGLVTGFLLP